jgi:anti-sigma-K factor RskA
MITKMEWQALHEHLMADERKRIGDPPAAEEVLAYTRGELSPEDEERIRERLVYYPELVRTLTAPLPEKDPEPADADYVPDEEMTSEWAAIQRRIHGAPTHATRVLQFWRAYAVAATLTLVIGGVWWNVQPRFNQPLVVEEQALEGDGTRSLATDEFQTITAKGDEILLILPIYDATSDQLQLKILDASANPPRVRWSTDRLQRRGQSLSVLVPTRFLKPGKYRIVLYGNDGAPLTTYSVRVPGT